MQLKKLSVETKSGIILGKIKDFILETESQNVLQYEVGGLIGKKYLINRNQVISIDEKKMVVEDSVVNVVTGRDLSTQQVGVGTSSVMMDETGN